MFQVKPQINALSNGVPPAAPVTPAAVLEVDDLDKEVAVGTVCRRKGCGVIFISDEVNRQGDGEGTVCSYHPLPVTFLSSTCGLIKHIENLLSASLQGRKQGACISTHPSLVVI